MKPSPSQPAGNQSGLCEARKGLDSCYKMGKNCGRYHIGHSRLHIENIVFQCQNIELFTVLWSNIKLGLVNNLYPTAKTKEGQEGFSLSEERSGVEGAWGPGGRVGRESIIRVKLTSVKYTEAGGDFLHSSALSHPI